MSNNICVLSIYCNFQDRTIQTLVNLLGSLCKQLTIDRGGVSKSLSEFREAHIKEQSLPTPSGLVEGLNVELKGFERVYIVIDGLDESSGEVMGPLVESLCGLIPTTQLLVTSRDTYAIRENFMGRGFSELRITANETDLERYINTQLAASDLGRMVDHSKSITREDVKQTVIGKTNGM